MLKAQISLQKAVNLPTLGIKSQPSPYIIVECEEHQFISPIIKYNSNPYWNCNFSLSAKKQTSMVNFYVYNNNTNGVDQLLAYGQLQFVQLLTKTNAEYKLRLVNSLHEIIESYIYFQHYNSNPKDEYLPLSNLSCMRLRIISSLQDMELVCHYGEKSFILMHQFSEKTFSYDPQHYKISFSLRGTSQIDKFQLQHELLVRNIGQNSFFRLRFYHPERDIYVYLAAGMIITGLLPENYNILSIKLVDLKNSSGKKSNNFKVKIYGPLNETYINDQKESEIYIQNHSNLLIEYFQQGQVTQGRQPYCSFKLPINSLNWKSQNPTLNHSFKYYDSFKSIQTILILSLTIKRTNQLSKTVPKLNPPQNLFDQTSNVFIEQFKLNNCYLYEVLNNTNVQLVHFDKNGMIRTTKKWIIKDAKSEIVIDTALRLPQGGKGVFALQCLDFSFAEKQTNNIEQSTIFKINLENINQFVSQKVDFCSKFLAFAKKKSLINVCKLFNQMVHDSLLTIKLKSRLSGEAKRGLLKIINVRATGKQADIISTLGIDGVEFTVSGLVGNYLLQKPYYFQFGKGNIDFSVEINNLIPEAQSILKQSKSQSYRFNGKIEQFFGTPIPVKSYLLQTKIAEGIKIQIIYEFIEKSLPKIIEAKRQKQYYFYSNCDIILKLSRAQLPNNKNRYKFSVNRSSYTYDSFEYKSNNNQICFNQEEIALRSYQKQQDFLFFNCYSHDQEDNLVIYNGAINVRQLFGKGEYEVLLTNQKQGKVQYIYLICQLLHSYPIVAPSLKLTISKLQLTQTVQSIRSLYKYYLLIRNNTSNSQIIECSLEERSFKVKWSTILQRNGSLHIDLYSSIKAISKEQFNQSQKELIARGQLSWPQIQDSGCFALNFYPKKQSQLKLTKNQLVLQEQTIRLLCSYNLELNKQQKQKQLMSTKKSKLDLDVLNDGLAKLTLNEYVELGLKGKVIQISIAQLGLQINAQSRLVLNKICFVKALNMQLNLNAVITTKEGTNYRKITSKVKVKLKGNHLKIHQQFPIKIVFQKYFYLTAQCVIFYNKFTCNTQGQFLFTEFNLQGTKVDRFQVGFCEQQKNIQNKESLLKKEGPQSKKCAIKVLAKDILNLLVLNIEGKGFKCSQFVYFGELNIDKYDEQQLFIKEIRINTVLLLLTIKYRYIVQKSQSKIDQNLKYTLYGSTKEKYLTMNYNRQVTDNNNRPKKTKGFLYKIMIPQCIALQNTTIFLVFQNQQKTHIKPSLINPREFNYYSNKKMKVNELKVINPQTANKPVECLGESAGVIKFIIDQNPKYICTLQMKQVKYADIGNQSWTFKFKLHQVLALSKKRLLHLKNTIHDEVLTKKLGIALKHADQCHFIYDLDQFGSTKDSQHNEVQFGYNTNSDILQVYLFVDNYFSRKMKENSERLFKNWIQLMPVSHSTINLSNMSDQVLIGTKLQPIVNNSIFLQKHINNLIVRQDDIFALGELSFERKYWSYIKLTFKNSTGLVLREDKSKNNAFIHYKIQIENGSRQTLKAQTTEARFIESQKDIVFTNNSLDVFLLQSSNQEQFNLKITGFIIDSSNHYQLFQKKHEISQFLQKRGKFQVNLTIKPPQTNNIIQNNFQLSIEINSESNKEVKFDLIGKAKEINKVDALSFRDMTGIQFLDKIVACEQLSHFYECLEQLKESFIYQQDAQTQLFILITQYYILSFDDHILEQICEITQLTLLKTPSILTEIQKYELTSFYYGQLKKICKGEQQRPPKEIPNVNSDILRVSTEQFRKEREIEKLRQLINIQKYLLFNKDKLFKPISKKHIQLVLAVIDLFLNFSNQFRQMFNTELQQWIELFSYVQSQQQFETFVGLVRVCMSKGVSLDKKVLIGLIQVMIKKQFSLYLIFEFWNLLEIKDKGSIYLSILTKYKQKFQENVIEVIRVAKMMFSKIAGSWNEGQKDKHQLHESILKIMIGNIQKTDHLQQIAINLELITCFNDYNILNEQQKKTVSSLIQKKISAQKNNNSKIILKGLLSKFIKQKQVKIIQKKDSKGVDSFSKQGFHMKYLITRD